MHKIIVANDFDAAHLVTIACIFRYCHDIDYVSPYTDENEPESELIVPEVLTRNQIITQIQEGCPFYVLDLDERNEVYSIPIILHIIESKLYIKSQDDNIPKDYLNSICSINTWLGRV